MYWSRVKTILIILFFAIDMFLIGYIVMTSEKPAVISETTVSDVVSVLKRNNITISPSIIPRSVESMGIVELDNLWVDNEALAKLLMETDTLTKEQDNVYSSNAKTVTFFNDYFVYTNANISEKSSTAQETTFLLNKMGISAAPEFAVISNGSMTFTQAIDAKPIFETAVTTGTDPSGAFTAKGYWIISNKQSGIVKKKAAPLLPVTGVLIDFTNNPYLSRNGDTIVSIHTGYTVGNIYRDTMHKLVSIIPAYQITMQNGDSYIYDAGAGEFLYGIQNGTLVLPQ